MARLFLKAQAKVTDVVDNRQQRTAYTVRQESGVPSKTSNARQPDATAFERRPFLFLVILS